VVTEEVEQAIEKAPAVAEAQPQEIPAAPIVAEVADPVVVEAEVVETEAPEAVVETTPAPTPEAYLAAKLPETPHFVMVETKPDEEPATPKTEEESSKS